MDQTIWNDISYGMYIIATQIQEKKVGCFINTQCPACGVGKEMFEQIK